jgi:hypothetical protein
LAASIVRAGHKRTAWGEVVRVATGGNKKIINTFLKNCCFFIKESEQLRKRFKILLQKLFHKRRAVMVMIKTMSTTTTNAMIKIIKEMVHTVGHIGKCW